MSSFAVRIVTAHKGGKFTAAPDFSVGDSKRANMREAERLQAAFDKDCDPMRAYVVAPDGMPVAAAGVPQFWPKASAL